MKKLLQLAGLAVSLCVSPVVDAHFVWVVASGDQVHVRFSESAESEEPELLKNVAAAKVWAQLPGTRGGASMEDVSLILTEQSLTGLVDAKASAVVLAHEYGVVTKGESTFLLKYLAKQHLSPLPGKWSPLNDGDHLPLEITPAWKSGKLLLTVTWKGLPVPDSEVNVSGCGLDKMLVTDEKGVALCEPLSEGLLSVRTKKVDESSGELNGEKYASIRTYSTLTLPVILPTVELQTHEMPPLPEGITSFGAAIVGNDLYVYGGQSGEAHHYSEDGQSNEFRRISLTSENAAWGQLPGGPKLTGLAMVEYGGKLYRVGGFTAKNKGEEEQSLWSQDSFAVYDPKSGVWSDLPSLPEGRSSHDAAVVDGKLYVVGGWNMAGPDKTTWHSTAVVCDLTQPELSWSELPAPPFQRRAVSAAAFQGKLYVIGGMQESGSITTEVAAYDPAAQAWSTVVALQGAGMEGFGTSAFAVEDRLVVTTMSGSVQTLNKEGNQWMVAGQEQEPRFFHRQLTTADGQILIIGGASMETGKTKTIELMKFVVR